MDQLSIQWLVELPTILDSFKLVQSILKISLCRGGGWGTALQNFTCHINALPRVILCCKPHKMLPNQFLTSTSTLLDIFSQLTTCQLAPGPFKEHLCTRGCQTGHKNKPWEKQTEEEWIVK